MQIIACQHDIAYANKPATHDRVRALLDGVDVRKGAMIVLPEMFATGYTKDIATMHDDEARELRAFLAELARAHAAYVMAGIVTRAGDGRGRNVCIVHDPQGNEVAAYQKIHPFSFSGEDELFEPGGEIVTFNWLDATVCPLVCYDLRFPEAFREGTRAGAQVFTVIASWPSARVGHWLALLRARAIENQAYVVGVNRCGEDPRNQYPGRSQIIDPRGDILADGGDDQTVISATIDLDALTEYRRTFPALDDMRL